MIYPISCIGFGLHWVWVYTAMLSAQKIFIPHFQEHDMASYIFAVSSFIALFLTQLIIGLSSKKFSSILTAQGSNIIFAVICAAGTLSPVWMMPQISTGLSSIICVFAGILTGIGSGYLLLLWGCAYSAMNQVSVASNTAIAFALAITIYYLLISYCAYPIITLITIFLPILEGIFLVLSTRDRSFNNKMIENGVKINPWTYILRIGFFAAILGLAIGTLREVSITSLQLGIIEEEQAVVLFGTIVLAVVIVHLILLSEKQPQERFSLRIPVLFAGVTVILLFIINDENSLIYKIVELVGYFSFEVAIWSAFVWIVHQSQISPLKVFGLGLAFISMGNFFGTISNKFILLSSASLSLSQIINPIILMFVLLLAIYLISAEKNVPGIIQTHDDREMNDTEKQVLMVASRYRLTNREKEVLNLLSKGRNIAFISKKLYISTNTTKTHMKRIFNKTDVHSRQDLMDLIDEAGKK
jgi:DNA-binding CsgD family transcriptional regulator